MGFIMRQLIHNLWRDQRGVTALEYAVLAGVVVVAVVAAGVVLKAQLVVAFTAVMTAITNAS